MCLEGYGCVACVPGESACNGQNVYHCDDVVGVSHFMTSLEEGRAIMEQLTGFTTGFAVPQYVVTTDLGKIPASREVLWRDEQGDVQVESYRGEIKNLGPALR